MSQDDSVILNLSGRGDKTWTLTPACYNLSFPLQCPRDFKFDSNLPKRFADLRA